VLAVGHTISGNVARLVESDGFGKERVRNLAEDTSFSTVTLEVDPLQAQSIALVMASGDNMLTLSLRNNDDTERTNLSAQNLGDVLGPDAARIQRGPAFRR